MKNRLLRAAAAIGLVLLLAVGAFAAWALNVPAPQAEALAALQSDANVTVEQGEWLVFAPAGEAPVTGLVFYPGGRVDARAYAPAARAIAAEGYLVVIVPMPLNLAVLAPGRAADVMAAYPEVAAWAVGGHSLGGAMAANFAAARPEAVRGLVLWAAYPAASDDLSAADLAVVSVYGTRDGVASVEDVLAAAERLPPDTGWVPLAGGNHAQFGWYGPQAGDDAASLSHADQQARTVAATVALLAALRHQ
jgi:pimeloyl-ACP methyl ester carboxylesterase